VYANNSLSNKPGGRVCVYQMENVALQQTRLQNMVQISINKMKLGALFFLYRKEYLPGENNTEIYARVAFNVFKSTIFPIRESQTTILNPPYSKHLLQKVNKLVLCYNFFYSFIN
jgi:hypothetical protein